MRSTGQAISKKKGHLDRKLAPGVPTPVGEGAEGAGGSVPAVLAPLGLGEAPRPPARLEGLTSKPGLPQPWHLPWFGRQQTQVHHLLHQRVVEEHQWRGACQSLPGVAAAPGTHRDAKVVIEGGSKVSQVAHKVTSDGAEALHDRRSPAKNAFGLE